MSEPIGMKIIIGGKLPADLVTKFLRKIHEDLSDIAGPTSEKELRGEQGKPVSWYAVTNYGECESLKSFCQVHGLGYVHTCEAMNDLDGEIKYWIPGMENEVIHTADQSGNVVVHLNQIKPLVTLLLDYAKEGTKNLSLHITVTDENAKELVEIGLKSPKKFLPALEKKIRELLPTLPELPPLTIK